MAREMLYRVVQCYSGEAAGNEKMENGLEHYVITSNSRFPNSAKPETQPAETFPIPLPAHRILSTAVFNHSRVHVQMPSTINSFRLPAGFDYRKTIPFLYAFLLDYTTLSSTYSWESTTFCCFSYRLPPDQGKKKAFVSTHHPSINRHRYTAVENDDWMVMDIDA